MSSKAERHNCNAWCISIGKKLGFLEKFLYPFCGIFFFIYVCNKFGYISLQYSNDIVSDGVYWDGSYEDDGTEDHIQTNQNQIHTIEAIKKTYSEIISELEGYVEKLENYDDSVNVILDVCNEVSYLNYPDDLVRNCNPVKVLKRFEDSHITEGLLQTARDYAYDSGDYNSYYDSELDDDATWESVNNTSYSSLARTPSRDVLHDVRVIYDLVGKLFELVKNK